jgi:hypothetical protein
MTKSRAIFGMVGFLGLGLFLGVNLVRQAGFQQSNVAMAGLLIGSLGMLTFQSLSRYEKRAKQLKKEQDPACGTKPN